MYRVQGTIYVDIRDVGGKDGSDRGFVIFVSLFDSEKTFPVRSRGYICFV